MTLTVTAHMTDDPTTAPRADTSRPTLVIRAGSASTVQWLESAATGQALPPLSERLTRALADWSTFFVDVDGDLTDPDISHEFVSQGFKLAHRLRAECKGIDVVLIHPVSLDRIRIDRS